jgi:hypothetical protein
MRSKARRVPFHPHDILRQLGPVLPQHFKCHKRHICIASPTASPLDIWNVPLSEALANNGYSHRLELGGFGSTPLR